MLKIKMNTSELENCKALHITLIETGESKKILESSKDQILDAILHKLKTNEPGKSQGERRRNEWFIARVRRVIEDSFENPAMQVNVDTLSERLRLSNTQLYRKIKSSTGYSSVEFIQSVRLEKAAELLQETDLSVKEVCYKVGFNSPAYFAKCFKRTYNESPRNFALQITA